MSNIKGIPLPQDLQLVSRIDELANCVISQRDALRYTDFLDERQLDVASGVLSRYGLSELTSFGGFSNAQRAVLCISEYDVPLDDFPICCIKIECDSPQVLSHRDYLGALMSLGIKRSKIGDIAVLGNVAYVAALKMISNAVLMQLESVGSCKVHCKLCDDFPCGIKTEFDPIRASVSSLRVDCVIAAALKISRQNAQTIIRRLGVKLNCRDVFSPDAKLGEDDVFSVKGYGKFKLSEIVGQSKKGKTIIIINKYN